MVRGIQMVPLIDDPECLTEEFMSLYSLAIGLTIFAQLSYHFCQKSINPQADMLLSMVATYAVALATTLLALPFFGRSPVGMEAVRQLNWASYGLGVSIFLFEMSFLLAYRAGWDISLAGLYSNVATGIILVPIGILIFKENLTTQNYLGIGLALVGIILMGRA
jgi:hypothetical protein